MIDRHRLLYQDALLIFLMAVLAACGLIYEYLLSHYAGRVLGSVEAAIYGIIGLMIVSMGLGSFAARLVVQPITAFAWLESFIAVLGITSILIIASIFAFVNILPGVIAETFLLPDDLVPEGGFILTLQKIAGVSPYIVAVLLGFLIGMEIPLIARIRQKLYAHHLEHNAGTIYGADYIGAGFGALIWVWLMLSMDITRAAVWTAVANLAAGLLFLVHYWKRIRHRYALLATHTFILILAVVISHKGEQWTKDLTSLLYRDEVVFSHNTRYQHMTVTRRLLPTGPIYGFHLNGRLQFSSNDEHIYHSMLVYPAMLAAEKHDRILIIGGGDGLALRNVLRFNPSEVRLIDLDNQVVEYFSGHAFSGHAFSSHANKDIEDSLSYHQRAMLELNEHAFSDPRVSVQFGDAFVEIDKLQAQLYDVIIVDLPDPSHPDLNRLYSVNFYTRLRTLLTGGGSLVVQSTSPYHARKAFRSIGLTVEAAGFGAVEQYRQNIPSFGEWGWTIATLYGKSPYQRIIETAALPVDDGWTTRALLLAAFQFPQDYYRNGDEIRINTLGSQQVYKYHHQAWLVDGGIYER